MKNWLQYKPAIIPYKGRYIDNWFSNMGISPFTADNYTFNSVEHFYQAMKSDNGLEFAMIALAPTPYDAKKMGRKVNKPFEHLVGQQSPFEDKVLSSVEDAKLAVMEMGLLYKFQLPEWREKLLNTGDARIIEWNNWKDVEWG